MLVLSKSKDLSAYGELVQSLALQLYEFAGLIQCIVLTASAGVVEKNGRRHL